MDDLLNTAPGGFLRFTDDGTILIANLTLATLLGYEVSELQGKRIESILPVASRIFYQTHFFPLLRLHGQAHEIYLSLRSQVGDEVPVLFNALRREQEGGAVNDCLLLPIRGRSQYEDEILRARRAAEEATRAKGELLSALHRANTELESRVKERTAQLEAANESLQIENAQHQKTMEMQRELAKALQGAKDDAERANQAKDEFLSRISHELRTPLNAILGFGQILDRQELSPRQKQSVGHIVKGGKHLLGLVNEILDISRVEAGNAELHIESVGLEEVLNEAYALVNSLAAQHGIHIMLDLFAARGASVLADRQRLQQVLINLLSNAIKYNHAGGKVNISAQSVEGSRLRIGIADTGQGLSAQDIQKLFTPFERLHAANSAVEGTGLGLVISQRLVTAMGGTLSVESEAGKGSTFWIELPLALGITP